MLEGLADALEAGPATYLLVLVLVAGDAVLPALPGETAVLTAATLAAGDGRLSVLGVFAAAALGAFLGDSLTWLLGYLVGGRAARRLFRSERGQARLGWASDQLDRRGTTIVVASRFVPGGRTAVTFSAGALGMPFRRFAPADALGAVLWAALGTTLGYVGGRTFADQTWAALALSFALAALFGVLLELARRVRNRRARTT